MRTQTCALLSAAAFAATFAAGCERKQTAAPPTEDHRKTVVAPNKAHLADYVKELPGSGDRLVAKIEVPQGTITCDLFPDKAPMTVANFIGLATGKKAWKNPTNGNIEIGKPFYDGLTFHRVIPDFMIQGGDPTGTGASGPGYTFGDETAPNDQMEVGTLAMANAGPATNGSQFFITDSAPKWLNGKHTIFGKCREIDVVKAVSAVPKVGESTPQTPIKMKVTISKSS
jgi:peptidyl-prolyl cis-trans isomerase A (cyclophilin A)